MSRRADEAIEILVVDNEDGFREVLSAIIAAETDMAMVGEANDGDEAVAKAEALVPHVVLLDVRMPHGGGIDTARTIKERLPTTKVIMLTASEDDDDLYDALRAGASGYLLKDSALVGLADSVRAAAWGQSVLSPSMAARLVADLGGPSPEPTPALTDRELQVLRLMAEGQANAVIAEGLCLSPNTVKRHVANILAKLHEHTRLGAVLHAQRRDLMG